MMGNLCSMIKNYKLTASLYANDYRPELKISVIFYKQSLFFICSHFYRAPKVAVECKIDSAIFNVKYQLSAKMLGLLTKWAQVKESVHFMFCQLPYLMNSLGKSLSEKCMIVMLLLLYLTKRGEFQNLNPLLTCCSHIMPCQV